MMEYAKEPWRLVGHGEVVGGDNNTVAVILEDVKAEANAKRIVVCVNACAGIETEWLENHTTGFADLVSNSALTKQRDQLLAVLELLVDAVGANCDADQNEMAVKPAMKRARATIATVKGGAPC